LQHIQDSESNLVNLLLELKKNNNMNSQIIDHILGYAEIITSQIISIFLDVEYFPVHELIKTDGRFGHATIDEEMTKKNFEKIRIKQQIIVPGNIGTDSLNQITILGLHGADYTAAIFAYLENANEIEI
jgi:aspartokinase